MRVGLGSDEHGSGMKEQLRSFLTRGGHAVRDFGPDGPDETDQRDVAIAVAEALREGEIDGGIILSGSGLDMAIAAGKVPGVLAAPVTDPHAAAWEPVHSEAQVIALGAHAARIDGTFAVVNAWLSPES